MTLPHTRVSKSEFTNQLGNMMELMKEEKEKKKIEIPIETDQDQDVEEDLHEPSNSPSSQEEEIDYADRLKRLQAEFLNYKRRVEKEKDEIGQFSKGNLVLSILPAVDDFERLIDHHENDDTVTVESIRLIYQKLIKALGDEGLQAIDSEGADFNPECHEALSVEEVREDQDNKVLEEWQKGYRFKDRLIRPSRVKVGKYTPSNNNAE